MFILFLVVSLVSMIAFSIAYTKRKNHIQAELKKEHEKEYEKKYKYISYPESTLKSKYQYDDVLDLFSMLEGLFFMLSVFFLIATCILSFFVFTSSTIDSKISMYEEENAKIEESIRTFAQSYMDFESETFSDLKNEDAISLITLYPELKSDTLVQKQIEAYLDNNAKIKELKEEKINVSKNRWLLYFGS